jgi:glycosyltransferase involved in cell wall biosynthesis
MVTLLTGPGTHISLLRWALQESGYLDRMVSYFPDWEVWDAHAQRVDTFRPYRWLTWAMWAVWRRLPRIGSQAHHLAWHFALYDWLTRQRVPLSPVLWAWWGTSLYTMRKARREGRLVLLEAHTCHPKTWNAIATSFYQEYPSKNKANLAILPPNYVARLEAELKEPDKIQVLSSFAKRTFMEAGIPEEKFYLLPLGVDTTIFYPEPIQQAEKFIVLYVGRIHPLKGIHYILESFSYLRLPNAELWLIGSVSQEMQPLLNRYVGDSIRYLGAKSHVELRTYYNQASVVVFPTLLDSFGLVILEAMACGKPVIATTHSGRQTL